MNSASPPKIFFIAGEHSGDVLGAGLLHELKAQGVTEFSGVGGPLMEEEGLESLLPMDELNVMGIWEVLWQLPRLIRLIEGVVAEIEKYNPDVVVTIDLPDFNFQVAHRLKKRGKCNARIVHYVAPSVWAWRPGRAKAISKFLDGLICLFPHEPPYFTKHNLNAQFVGHPLIEHDPKEADGAKFRAEFSIPPEAPVLGLFFGSREGEIKMHGQMLVDAAQLIHEQYPDMQLVVPTLPQMEYEVREIVSQLKYPAFVLMNPDDKWDEFAACNVALAVSGTVGLELAYMGIPHIITYKMHPVSWVLVRLLVKTKYAHLANILLNQPAIPEYLQKKANAVELGKGLLKLFKDENERKAQLEKTSALPALLTASPDQSPSALAAAFVIEVSKQQAKKLTGRDAQISVGDVTKALAARIPSKDIELKPTKKKKPKAVKKSA